MTKRPVKQDARLQIVLPSALKARLIEVSDQRDMPISRIVRRGINAQIKLLEQPEAA